MKKYFFTFLLAVLFFSCWGGVANAQLLPPQSLSYEMPEKGTLRVNWEYPNSKISYPINPMEEWLPFHYWEINSSNCMFSDGTYLYLSSGANFLKHDMEGNYLETISIDGLPVMMQVTSDGEYFYGVADGGLSGKYGIYKFDIKTRKLLDITPTPVVLLHITYIPELDGGKGGFEAGNPDRGYYFNMKGEYLGDGPNFNYDVNGAARNATYCNGKLYTFHQTPGSMKVIVEFDINTNLPTGNRFDLTDLSGHFGFTESQMAISFNIYEDLKAGTMNAAAITYWTTTTQAGYRVALFKLGERPKLQDLQGYNIYRNNNKLNTSLLPVTSYSYSDKNLEEGIEYTYTMTAVYNGVESDQSESLAVSLPYTNQLPLAEDFNSNGFDTDSWTIFKNNLQTAWVVTNSSSISALEEYLPSLSYTYRFSADYGQTFSSKSLKIEPKDSSFIRFDVYCAAKQSNEQLNIEVYRGGEWQTVHTIPSWSATEWEHQTVDLSTALEGFEGNFQVRFRFSGSSTSPHNWYIDNIKIWNPGYVEFGGKIYQGNVLLKNASITLDKVDDSLISYQIDTDENDVFYAPAVEKGTYKLCVFVDGELIYRDDSYLIETSDKNMTLKIVGPILEMDNTSQDIIMGEDKSMVVRLPIHNTGNSTLNWSADLIFDKLGTGNEIGENNIPGSPAWQMANTFELRSASEKSLIYHQGHFYTLSSPLTLNKYTLEGEYLSSETISSPYSSASIVSDGNKIYQVTYNYKIIPIDHENNTVIESETINTGSITLDRIWYATYDPKTDGFYVGNEHYLLQVDRKGNSKEFTINELPGTGYSTYAFAVTMDTFSEGGPYLWIISSKDAPEGDLRGTSNIFQYSIPEETLKTSYKLISELPGYTGQASPVGLTASTAVIPGYMTLSGIVNYNSKATVFTYKMVPFENWLLLDKLSGSLPEGETENFFATLNTDMLSEGDTRQGKLIVSSNSVSEDVEISITLGVDNSMESKCLAPINLSAELSTEYKVKLNWEMPEGTELIQGYNVYKNGTPCNIELITETQYTDMLPAMGEQSYTVQAVYSFGCESKESDPATILVENPSILTPVNQATAKVVNGKHVQLDWEEPYFVHEIYEDFESYDHFSIDNIGDWTLYDGDRAWTYYDSNLSYPNRGTRMAYMVFNPSACYPASSIATVDGSKQLLIAFANNVDSLRDNNWIISPELNFDRAFTFSFMAKSHSHEYKEEINIAYSLTGNSPEDFIKINGDTPISLNAVWTEYSHQIPANAKYVAINHVTLNGFMSLFDNIFIGHPEYYSEFVGYNVYRNNEKLNSKILSTPRFTEYNLEDGEYTYEVEAIYANGIVSNVTSNSVTVDYSHQVTAPSDLAGEIKGKEVQLTWNAPVWEEEFKLRYDNGIPHYDAAIGNPLEEHLIGIRFDATDISVYEGYSITGVEFYIADKVNYVYPFIFVDGQHLELGKELQVKPKQYITYYFPTPVKIEAGKEYIIGYSFETPEVGYYPVSHDDQVGTPGKSDLVSSDGGRTWSSTYQTGGAEWKINWNIAALVELQGEINKVAPAVLPSQSQRWSNDTKAPATMQKRQRNASTEISFANNQTAAFGDLLTGYNVYRNKTLITPTPIKTLNYTDTSVDVSANNIEYYVTAVYAESGEKASNAIIFNQTAIEGVTESDISIYPNPATDKLYVKGDFDSILLTSVDGQVVYRGTSGTKLTIIDVENLSSGVYLLITNSGKQTNYNKIIIK